MSIEHSAAENDGDSDMVSGDYSVEVLERVSGRKMIRIGVGKLNAQFYYFSPDEALLLASRVQRAIETALL